MSVKLIQTKTAVGTIVAGERGQVLVDGKVAGRLTRINSNIFEKFPSGTVVEFQYKELPNMSIQVLKALPVNPDSKYDIKVVDFDFSVIQGLSQEHLDGQVDDFGSFLTRLGIRQVVDMQLVRREWGKPTFVGSVLVSNLDMAESRRIVDLINEDGNNTVLIVDRKPQKVGTTTMKFVGVDPAVPEEPIFEAPEWVKGPQGQEYWFSPSMRKIATATYHMMEAGECINIAMFGESGYGKTSNAEGLAAMLGYEIVHVNCAEKTSPEEWFGYPEARGGETVFIETELTTAVRKGKVVILLDEANRLETHLHNVLFPLLDHRRRTRIHNTDIVVAPSVVFIMTMNLGVKFSGTFTVDGAIMNRLDIIEEVEAPPAPIETKIVMSRVKSAGRELASAVVSIIRELRAVVAKPSNNLDCDVSTRSAIKATRLHAAGMSMEDALTFTIVNTVQPAEDRKSLRDAIKSRTMQSK